MLKGLTRKLITLSMLVAALATVQARPAKRIFCERTTNGYGECVIVCCNANGDCIAEPC